MGEVQRFAKEVGSDDPVVAVGGGTHLPHLLHAKRIGAAAEKIDTAEKIDAAAERVGTARQVRAPAGVWEYEPSEMTVRCGAGTTLAELDEVLAPYGQMVPFDACPDATVGGTLASGLSGYRRLRYGHVRDLVLQTRHIDHTGQVVTAGGPTVKNVSGYDLCRLLVGSWGTLGFLAEVILRCLPQPAASQWFVGKMDSDPFELRELLYRPSSILWDGTSVWVLLEGHPDDVASEAAKLRSGKYQMKPIELSTIFGQADLLGGSDKPSDKPGASPDRYQLAVALSTAKRMSLRPGELGVAGLGTDVFAAVGESAERSKHFSQRENVAQYGRSSQSRSTIWLAEVGVGVVHYAGPVPTNPMLAGPLSTGPLSTGPLPTGPTPSSTALMQALKERLDPRGRLNPGFEPW